VVGELNRELGRMSQAKYESIRRSQESFTGWLKEIARSLGRLISTPIRMVFEMIAGFLDGLFGDDDR